MFSTEENIEMLNSLHELEAMASDMLDKIDANAHSDAQKSTAAIIRLVVETQSGIINKLMEHQMTLDDLMEPIFKKLDQE